MKTTTADNACVPDGKRPFFDSPGELYVVSVSKFVLLYLLTGGGYIFYWSYRNWTSFRAVGRADIMPAMRAVFWPFFILELFDKIQKSLDISGRSYRWYSEARALLIMLLVMIAILLSLFFDRPSDTGFVLVADAVLVVAGVFLFIGAQRAINVLGDDPQGRSNHAFSSANLLCTLAGGMALAFVGYIEFAGRP